jgi:hypothetical protein
MVLRGGLPRLDGLPALHGSVFAQAKIGKREADLEAMVFEQRQQLLAAIEHVRNREAELK